MREYIVTVDGKRGSGKTTLLQAISEHLYELGFDVSDIITPGGTAEYIKVKVEDIIKE